MGLYFVHYLVTQMSEEIGVDVNFVLQIILQKTLYLSEQ